MKGLIYEFLPIFLKTKKDFKAKSPKFYRLKLRAL